MQKIVTIGGGTGHFQVLKGLKNYECDIAAIVNMSDNGGSSGRLRDEYGILPPGDVRQCIIGLANEGRSEILRELFMYRFKDGHNLGNLIIAALTEICGGEAAAIKEASRILQIRGNVLPVTINDCVLIGETNKGEILKGESKINSPSDPFIKILNLYHEPKSFLYHEAGKAIRTADKIIVCPGDLYGSILPNFIVEGMKDALKESNGIKICVVNLFTKQGTYNFKASDFVKEVEKYSGVKMDKIIVNKKNPSQEVINEYFSEHSKLVDDDLGDDPRVIRGKFAAEYLSEPKTILRHIPEKIAHVIFSLS